MMHAGSAVVALVSLLVLSAVVNGDESHSARPVEFTAHRGESHDAPENTMAAFKLAWERGDAAAELDIHLTQDGKLIVCHDADTKRTAGAQAAIKSQTAEGLRKLDVGSWKSKDFSGEKMPLLDEVLASIPDGRRLFIEIKIGPEAVPELLRCVERSGKKPEQLVVISFNLDSCAAAKKALPKLKCYYLASPKQDKETKKWSPTAKTLIGKAKSAGVDGLDIAAGPVDKAFVDAVHAAGLEMYVWTVDDPKRAKELVEAGVDGITSNRAAWLKEQVTPGK
jgi:glycerophosphoryl diester phosphodiesterase